MFQKYIDIKKYFSKKKDDLLNLFYACRCMCILIYFFYKTDTKEKNNNESNHEYTKSSTSDFSTSSHQNIMIDRTYSNLIEENLP